MQGGVSKVLGLRMEKELAKSRTERQTHNGTHPYGQVLCASDPAWETKQDFSYAARVQSPKLPEKRGQETKPRGHPRASTPNSTGGADTKNGLYENKTKLGVSEEGEGLEWLTKQHL